MEDGDDDEEDIGDVGQAGKTNSISTRTRKAKNSIAEQLVDVSRSWQCQIVSISEFEK